MNQPTNPLQRDLTSVELEVYDAVADILMVLADVAGGDLSTTLELPYPDQHPLGALAAGINEMIKALSEARERSRTYQRDLEEKIETIERQRAAIKELSTPTIEVWDGVLCLPIVGVLDSTRAAEMTESLLGAVVEKQARYTIIDITGIEIMDTRAADHFLRMAKAVRLLGAECVLSGVNPNIATTIVHMGVDMSGIASHRNLRDALQHYVGRIGRQDGYTDVPNGG